MRYCQCGSSNQHWNIPQAGKFSENCYSLDCDFGKYYDHLCVFRYFAEESQTKMLPLIFTTVEGKEGYFSQSSGFFYDNSSVICRNYRKCMGIMQNRV